MVSTDDGNLDLDLNADLVQGLVLALGSALV
jgi:hypothetical protein